MELKNVNQRISDYQKENIATVNSEMERMALVEKKADMGIEVMQMKIPLLVESLKKLGLEISDFGFSQPSVKNDKPDDIKTMKLVIVATSISGKFRFINFNGYTSSGAGKNQKRLWEKAEGIAGEIKKYCGFDVVSVNPYSLEVRGDEDGKKRVLIDCIINL